MRSTAKYEIENSDGSWTRCQKAEECTNGHAKKSGWLHYQLRDGTNGLKRPGTWRKVQ